MTTLLVHAKDLGEAMDIRDIFYNHSKVKENPEIIMKADDRIGVRLGIKKCRTDFMTSIKLTC